MDTSFSIYIPEERDVNFMSLCGMVLTIEGIVAFTDSKATKRHWMGHLIEDKERKPQKLVYNDDIVIVTTGYNQYCKNGDYYLPLEELLAKVITCFSTTINIELYTQEQQIKMIYQMLKSELDKTISLLPEAQFLFLVGLKGFHYSVSSIEISKNSRIMYHKIVKPGQNLYFYIGDDTYCKLMADLKIIKNYPIDNIPQFIKEVVSHMIAINDLTMDYNPVGGEIHTYIFK